jgi:predicted site-specific integrase-resolvase
MAGPQKGMLQGLDQEVLDDFAEIVTAFSRDLSGERMRRMRAANDEDAQAVGRR